MPRSDQSPPSEQSTPLPQDLAWSRKNTMVLAAGVVLLTIGFLFLWMTKQEVAAWPGRLSPFFILLGYLLTVASVLVGDQAKNREDE